MSPSAARRLAIALLALILAAAACALPGVAGAKVLVSQLPDQYYIVQGRTHQEIGRALHDNMVRFDLDTGDLAAAVTYGEMSFKYRYGSCGAGCVAVKDVEVLLKLRYVYPKWVSRDYAQPDVVRDWDQLMGHLVVHEEQGHGSIWKEGARSVERALMAAGPQRGAEALHAWMQRTFEAAMADVDRRHQAFDLLEKNNHTFRPFFVGWRD